MSIEELDQSPRDRQARTHARTHTMPRYAHFLSDLELTSDGWLLVELELVVHKSKNKTRLSNSSLAYD